LYLRILHEASLYETLFWIDAELAETARRGGCECGAALHRANYPRKPRGAQLGPEYDRRLSFCCGRCRRRCTPRSVRFLGRKVYLSVVVTLLTTLRCGATPVRVARLRAAVGVDERTLRRWRRWWQVRFAQSRFWRAARGRFVSPVQSHQLPASLLERFGGELGDRLVALLRFVAPLSTRTCPRGLQAL